MKLCECDELHAPTPAAGHQPPYAIVFNSFHMLPARTSSHPDKRTSSFRPAAPMMGTAQRHRPAILRRSPAVVHALHQARGGRPLSLLEATLPASAAIIGRSGWCRRRRCVGRPAGHRSLKARVSARAQHRTRWKLRSGGS